MQLYKYNLLEKKRLQHAIKAGDHKKKPKYFARIPGYCIEEEENKEVHLMFAHCVGNHNVKIEDTFCEKRYMHHHYVLKQEYFKEKSKEQLREEREEREKKRYESEMKKIPYEEEPEVGVETDFSIIHFSYE
jgi:hypothetical protein